MSERISQRSESIQTTGQTTGVMAGAALAESRPVIVRMLTQDDLPCDDGDWSERLKYLRMPTQDDLPYDDGEPMESELHLYQIILFLETLKLHWADRDDFFVGGNMAVYFSAEHVKKQDFRGPDFFIALGVDGKRMRKSWVMWEEEKGPDLVMEFLSNSTAAFDREGKKQIYHDQLRVPEYFYYDPLTGELAGFEWTCEGYQPLIPDHAERLISNIIGLALVRWVGKFNGVTANWLRWATLDGKLLPTKDEAKDQSDKLAERLTKQLRALGVEPESLD